MKAGKIFSMVLALTMTLGLMPQATYAADEPLAVEPVLEPTTEESVADPAADTVVSQEIPAAGGDIAIIYTNDIHCGVTPVVSEEDGTVTNMGYAGVAGFVDSVEAAVGEANVTLVDAGDATQGDAIGTLSKGQYLVDIMNEMGYDIFVPGNHEFDYGMEQMQALMNGIEGDVISSNFMDLSTNAPVFDGYSIISYGDVDVAFVGITTPESFTKSTPKYFQDAEGNYIYGLCEGNDGADLYAAVQASVDAAVAEGAEYVIAVGHLGVDEISAPWRSVDVIANTSGIDAFIDGHSHTVMEGDLVKNADGEDVLLTQTGTKLANVGYMTISADGTISAELVTGYAEVNEEIDAFVSGKMAEHEEALAEIVATTDVALAVYDPASAETRIVRSQETNLGDLASDAYRYVLGNGAGEPADIGFVNGGGIRVDIPAGEISFGEVISVHPYNNVGMVVEATGQEILDALEVGAMAVPGESGGFLHVSGITFTIDATVESTVELTDRDEFVAVNGARRVKDVMVGEEPIDPAAVYTLASHNYMLANGGDGLNMFMDNTVVVQPVILDNQVLISYIQDFLNGVVGEEYSNPYGQGRISIILPEADGITAEDEPLLVAPIVNAPTQTPDAAAPSLPFTDVPADSAYFDAVNAMYSNGLVSGTGDNLYNPDAVMTNAMAVTLLYNHAGKPQSGAAAGVWYADAAAWAAANGIISADSNIDFNAEITTEAFNGYLTAYAESAGLEFGARFFDNSAFTRADAALLMNDFLEQVA